MGLSAFAFRKREIMRHKKPNNGGSERRERKSSLFNLDDVFAPHATRHSANAKRGNAYGYVLLLLAVKCDVILTSTTVKLQAMI